MGARRRLILTIPLPQPPATLRRLLDGIEGRFDRPDVRAGDHGLEVWAFGVERTVKVGPAVPPPDYADPPRLAVDGGPLLGVPQPPPDPG